MPIFEGAFAAGANYLDMAMSLSRPDPDAPHERTGVKLGDKQFGLATDWETTDRLALVGIGVEPGLSDVFARYAADHLFDEIDEIGVRDGANLVVEAYDFAPSLSIWTTIEECLNPPVVWEREQGLVHHAAVLRAGDVRLSGGDRAGRMRQRRARRGAPDPALGRRAAGDLQVRPRRRVHRGAGDPAHTGSRPDRQGPGRRGRDAPRDVVAAASGSRHARRPNARQDLCRRVGHGNDGRPAREVYLYHVVDNETTMALDGSQAVVWQTAINPVVALELLASGTWTGTGVLGPEAFDAVPFLDLLPSTARRGDARRRGLSSGRPEHAQKRSLCCDATSRHQ